MLSTSLFATCSGTLISANCGTDFQHRDRAPKQSKQVTEVAAELQKRVVARGLTGQVQRSEDTVSLLRNLDSKLDRIEMKLDRVLDDKMLR